MRTSISVGLLLVASAVHASNSNLAVSVFGSNGAPIPGAQVVALNFQNGNPNAAVSRVAFTDGTGTASFTAPNDLVPSNEYQIVVASQGFLPSLVDQFNAGPLTLTADAPSPTPPGYAVRLTTVGTSNLGEIDLHLFNAAANSLVFGQIGLRGGGGAIAYGVAATDGVGNGLLRIFDVHYASAGYYQISAFDAAKNRSQSYDIGITLDAGAPLVAAGSLPTADFSLAPPPSTAVNNQSGTGGLGADIVVTDTNSAPIPFIGVGVSGAYLDGYGQWHYDQRGGSTDQTGHLQLYSLLAGVTYYSSVGSTCQNGSCYQGFQSSALSQGLGTAPGPNDFLYASTGTALHPTFSLHMIPAGTGTLAVYVTDQFGNPFPQSNVSVSPDWSPWNVTGGVVCGSATASNPGLTSFNTNAATGYVLLSGLQSGNYQLNAYTQYGPTSFNKFAYNGASQYGICSSSNTEVRLAIDTTTAPNFVRTFDARGNPLTTASSATIVVNVSTSGTGLVGGTLTFPSVVDLSASPIVVTLQPQCNNASNCGNSGGGFKAFTGASMGPVVNFTIPVSSGQAYSMSFASKYWGAITAGGSQLTVDLRTSTSAFVPISLAPAGRVLGSLRKPDGSVYLPRSGQNIWVDAEGNNSWGNGQLAADGSFTIGGLLPGVYGFRVGSSDGGNSFPYTTKQPSQQFQINAGQDTFQDSYLDNSVPIKPFITISSLPALSIPAACPANTDCPAETWSVFALAAGTPLSAQTLTQMLVHGGDSQTGNGVAGVFDYKTSTGPNNGCSGGGNLVPPGFCVTPIPAKPGDGSAYDFYLARKGGFDSGNTAGGARPNLVLMASTSNVIVSQARAHDPVFQSFGGASGSTTTAQDIVLSPSRDLHAMPQAVLFGTFTISNMINRQQFNQLAGKFDNFTSYLPIVYLYDASGTFRAAGIGVPFPPAEKPLDAQLNQAVANNDYGAFNTLISMWGPLGYEIRGLTAGTTYNLVATSPNYPPFKTQLVLGAAQSTTTVNVDFDANPGASLFGLVLTTASSAIANAQVTVSAPGYTATTLTTDVGGHWSIGGLGAGRYALNVVAAGYVQQTAAVDVSARAAAAAPTFALVAADARISGSVYTNNPICPAGATGCAAFGRAAVAGASVVAYDDTLNAQNPAAPLALYRAVTNSSGAYTLSGISSGDSYKVFVNAPGYYVLNQSTLAIPGTRAGFDFALKPKPLSVNVYGRPNGQNYEFAITNYQSFSSGKVWIGPSPFVKATSTDVSNSFAQKPDSQGVAQLVLDYPLAGLTAGTVYVMHLEAQPNDPGAALVTTEVRFGLDLPHNTCQAIDQALLGDDASLNGQGLPLNTVPLDISGGSGGNSTALSLPAGGVIPVLSTSIPSMCMSETDASASPQAQAPGVSSGAFASGVYSMTLSSVNYTQKGVDLTLSYNQNGTDIADAAVFTYDAAAQKWQSVPGVQTLDPVKGTITVKGIKSLSSVLSLKAPTGLMAVSDGRGYRPNAVILRPDDTGLFAVMRPSQVGGGAYSGTTVRIFNFPNPFSLQTKNVTLNTTAGVCAGLTGSVVTDGTVIKYEIPAGVRGTGVIRIYTLSGRLVREVDAGNVAPGACYYTVWDGKNKSGQPVANGVYYGVLSVGGNKQTSGTFKLAVIK